ncbi:hypothetical protein [Rhodonellum sp.]|uniref:hypothetical protein n=1 Tax=Rhodonellum sp. TaxID=2231180 RepID=UPI00272072B6|nr:hypothetical protein [Rhodonellum sp.]MDO9554920.1 hypothetical protein [Rhodonellum sp.]
MDSLLRQLKSNLINIPGWKTNRKIVVFESDDWGMQRMASKASFNRLEKKGYRVSRLHFDRFDSLESNGDVGRLLELLSVYRDRSGAPAKFTMNMIMGNPDFDRIRTTGFEKYYHEPFYQTLKRFSDKDEVMDLYREGMQSGCFRMQFHGREHVHINRWLARLRATDRLYLDAFDEGMYALESGHLDAMAMYEKADIAIVKESIAAGMVLFEQTWGFKSASIIAPCYTWGDAVEKVWAAKGVEFIQGGRVQKRSIVGQEHPRTRRHYTGEKSSEGMRYMIRNVSFEPVTAPRQNWVNTALAEVATAFRWGKPAIISTHRLNYIGSLVPENSKKNLHLLGTLLGELIRLYPDMEFLSSDELGGMIASEKE